MFQHPWSKILLSLGSNYYHWSLVSAYISCQLICWIFSSISIRTLLFCFLSQTSWLCTPCSSFSGSWIQKKLSLESFETSFKSRMLLGNCHKERSPQIKLKVLTKEARMRIVRKNPRKISPALQRIFQRKKRVGLVVEREYCRSNA